MHRLRSVLLAAALSLSGAAVGATDFANLTAEERAAFRAEVRAYLLDNPEVLLEVFTILEERQIAAETEAEGRIVAVNAEALFEDSGSWVGGNPEGDVTVVEFIDYRCGYCRRAVDEVNLLLDFDTDVRLVRKEFPILGEASLTASRFAVATLQVAGDDAYASVHAALMSYAGEWSGEALAALGTGLGLDGAAIAAHMNRPEVSRVIADNHALAQRLQINGTPSFVIGDRIHRGMLPAPLMADMVEAVRARRD